MSNPEIKERIGKEVSKLFEEHVLKTYVITYDEGSIHVSLTFKEGK